MSDRPILFSAAMVRALLANTKTQTRRIITPQPFRGLFIQGVAHLTHGMDPSQDGAIWYDTDLLEPGKESRCSYGVPGDRLWVRESWGIYDGEGMAYTYPNGIPKAKPRGFHASYPADDDSGIIGDVFKWRPSIHMPRWASRLTLEIVSVRAERLQDINEADAIAEGIARDGNNSFRNYLFPEAETYASAVESYRSLWTSINGAGSWGLNPWVWVVEFRRVEQ